MGVEILKLSGSTDGKGIKVTQTATPGDLIHTAHASQIDRPFIWVVNHHTAVVTVTIEWGGTTDPDDLIVVENVPVKVGRYPIAPGEEILTNSLVVRIFASVANVVRAGGYVFRYN